jgi:hypothetical protein
VCQSPELISECKKDVCTMVYTKSFVVDLKLHASIKQFINYHSVYELYELSVHPSIYVVRGSADDLPSKGCTCPYGIIASLRQCSDKIA